MLGNRPKFTQLTFSRIETSQNSDLELTYSYLVILILFQHFKIWFSDYFAEGHRKYGGIGTILVNKVGNFMHHVYCFILS